ncbi:hypothetical protein AS034_14205 [[Bacillus] enclensis]|nr:hypothetical protein AS034_14205 [[Bacillus] enclensis]
MHAAGNHVIFSSILRIYPGTLMPNETAHKFIIENEEFIIDNQRFNSGNRHFIIEFKNCIFKN